MARILGATSEGAGTSCAHNTHIDGSLSAASPIHGSLSSPGGMSGGLSVPSEGEGTSCANNTHIDGSLSAVFKMHGSLSSPVGMGGGLSVPKVAVSPITPATYDKLGGVIVGEDLQITEDGVLSVIKADFVEEDNTRPITAAAVYTEVGNINTLLATI